MLDDFKGRLRFAATGAICLVFQLLATTQVSGQQAYVGRYDIYAGYAYLNSPHISLGESGFQTQAGIRLRRWVTLGFDFSAETGDTKITPGLLTTGLQQQLGAEFQQLAQAGVIPAGYSLVVPIHSGTQTYAGGVQFSWHGLSRVTIFARPDFGAMHEVATPHPGDPIATGVVQQLAPSGKKVDTVPFYGFGGGVDINLSEHVAIRIQADFVHDHLFDDLLKDSRNTVRIGIGPAFQFGRNVEK